MTAHSRFLTSTIAALALLTSGCVFTTTPRGNPGDITFTWTFANRQCFEVPDVVQVTVDIPGQSLQNSGVYGCLNANSAGIKLLNFRAGSYSYTISGQNAQGVTIYAQTGRVTVNGDVVENVNLTPTANATGSAYLAWTLPAGTSVTCQYLAAVDISFDSGAPTAVACNTGLYNPGNTTTLQGAAFSLSPGRHTVNLDARDATGFVYYRSTSFVDVVAGQTAQQVYSLDWLVGTTALRWTFSNGITQLTCAQAGVTRMGVTLRDANGDLTVDVDCNLGGIDGYTPYAYTGQYQVFLAAYGTGNVLYASSVMTPRVVQVQAGVFPPLTTQVPQTLLVVQ